MIQSVKNTKIFLCIVLLIFLWVFYIYLFKPISSNFTNCIHNNDTKICSDIYSDNGYLEYGFSIYPLKSKLTIDSVKLDEGLFDLKCILNYPYFGSINNSIIDKGFEFYLTSDASNYGCVQKVNAIDFTKIKPKLFCIHYTIDGIHNLNCIRPKVRGEVD